MLLPLLIIVLAIAGTLGIAGWFAALLMFGFIGAAFAFATESAAAAIGVGLLLCAAAWLLFRIQGANEFVEQFALAVSISGQGFVLFGLAKGVSQDVAQVAIGMIVLQAALFFLVDNFVHRVWCAMAASAAFAVLMADLHLLDYAPGLFALASAAVWLHEFHSERRAEAMRAAGYGFVLALLVAAGVVIAFGMVADWGDMADYRSVLVHAHIGRVLSGIALLWACATLLAGQGLLRFSAAGLRVFVTAGVIVVANQFAPGLAPAMLIVILGFGHGNRLLLGSGVIALLAYLSFYYYSLQTTLLVKSMVMIATGLALLAVRYVIRSGSAVDSQVNHA